MDGWMEAEKRKGRGTTLVGSSVLVLLPEVSLLSHGGGASSGGGRGGLVVGGVGSGRTTSEPVATAVVGCYRLASGETASLDIATVLALAG